MRATLVVVVSVMLMADLCGMAVAGSIDSPGAPSSGSGMYSLSQIYDYLNSGIKATPAPSFQEPGAAPGSTMKTTKEIYDDILAKFDLAATTTAEDVKSGKPFFCTQLGSWGVQTGTLVVPPTPTPTPTATPWVLNADTCNATALPGWKWINANDGGSCWSKTLADSVSWNKNVGGLDGCGSNDCTASSGAYICNTDYTLKERMIAAAAGEWWKIVISIGGHNMATTGEDGQSGAQYISALAIADCIDGVHDLGTGTGSGTLIAGCQSSSGSWSACNTTLRAWANTGGKSALPRLTTDTGNSQATNDYWDACADLGAGNDVHCTGGNDFFVNHKACGDGDINYSWAAACGDTSGDYWSTTARVPGYFSCSWQSYGGHGSSGTDDHYSFRVVVRPAE